MKIAGSANNVAGPANFNSLFILLCPVLKRQNGRKHSSYSCSLL